MNAPVLWAVLGLAIALPTGCTRRIRPGKELTWKVELVQTLERGGRFAFQVEAFGADGQAVEDAPYYWEIDWVGVRTDRKRGKTFKLEELRAQGDAGTGTLRIFAADPQANLVEVAAKPFRVK